MNLAKIEVQLIAHEGERLVLYRCTAGKSSIGIGHNLTDNGITQEMSRFIFGIDLQECIVDLSQRVFLGQFEDFPEDIQHVLINMRFQLGHTGFRNFKKMITAYKKLDLEEAVKQMKDSNWFHQVPGRANDLIKMVEGFQKGKE